ncbi:hypothetical protein [Streptomyces sp. NBC_01589]|uniref:hypothetical protein n=1 Tax=unclassified Streptomyces TaxID=2593676 RepID=UPI00386A23A5
MNSRIQAPFTLRRVEGQRREGPSHEVLREVADTCSGTVHDDLPGADVLTDHRSSVSLPPVQSR